MYFNCMIIIRCGLLVYLLSDDLDNSELSALAENFREQAARLVDMLDTSIPVVARLKVSIDMIHPYLWCCAESEFCDDRSIPVVLT